jgi:hypothetical protein
MLNLFLTLEGGSDFDKLSVSFSLINFFFNAALFLLLTEVDELEVNAVALLCAVSKSSKIIKDDILV